MAEKIHEKVKKFIFGKPLNELNPLIKNKLALIAVIAWIGLGADGLSSSAYGPEQSYIALGSHTHLAIYLAIATSITIFIIALSYNQVIELFPNGGGGYKVASHLLGQNAGALAGCALIIDYILTIATSTAAAVDALFNLLPHSYSHQKLHIEFIIIILLIMLNLRGVKESIKILVPLFIGFLVTHIIGIVGGIFMQKAELIHIFPFAANEFAQSVSSVGLFTIIALFLKAYSMGGGTYTGLEAVSNNIHMLAEPRVRTGKLTMLYMAISLSILAGGIILIYTLYDVKPHVGMTLNGVVFKKITHDIGLNNTFFTLLLFFEAAILIVAANSGFLGCPSVMANMAVDKWLPRQFRELSDRLVTQNGILICGAGAIFILLWAGGEVSTLVILYSINVFITFSLALLGLCVYWLKARHVNNGWLHKFIMSLIGFILCSFILVISMVEKFSDGAWLTLLLTGCFITICYLVRYHYKMVGKKLGEIDALFANQFHYSHAKSGSFLGVEDKNAKTAVFFVNKHYGAGLHALLWVRRLFPNVFTNFIFLTAGEVDVEVFSNNILYKQEYRKDLNNIIEHYRYFCTENSLASDGLFSYGVDEIEELVKLSKYIQNEYTNCVFFASKLVFTDERWWTRILHNNTVDIIQRQLHLQGIQMVILPMKI